MASVPNIQFADPVGSFVQGFAAPNIIIDALMAPQRRALELQQMELDMQVKQGDLALQQRRLALLESEHAHQVATRATELEYAHEERLRDMKLDRMRLQNQRIRNDLDRQELEAREKARLHAKAVEAQTITDIGYGQGAFDQAGAGDPKTLRKATARQRVLDQPRLKASAAEHKKVGEWRDEARAELDRMQLEYDMAPLQSTYYNPDTGRDMPRTLFDGGVVTVGEIRKALTGGNRKVHDHVMGQLREGGYTDAEIKAFLGGKEPVFNDDAGDEPPAPVDRVTLGTLVERGATLEATFDASQRERPRPTSPGGPVGLPAAPRFQQFLRQ